MFCLLLPLICFSSGLYDKNSENYELVYVNKFQYKAHGIKFLVTSSNVRIVGPYLIVCADTTFCDYFFTAHNKIILF